MNMDEWDIVLLLIAVYFSVVLLVRSMNARRDSLIDDARRQIKKEQLRLEMVRTNSKKPNTANEENNDREGQAA